MHVLLYFLYCLLLRWLMHWPDHMPRQIIEHWTSSTQRPTLQHRCTTSQTGVVDRWNRSRRGSLTKIQRTPTQEVSHHGRAILDCSRIGRPPRANPQTRGGPTSIQGYSAEYPLFLQIFFIYTCICYVYIGKYEIDWLSAYLGQISFQSASLPSPARPSSNYEAQQAHWPQSLLILIPLPPTAAPQP